MSTALHTRQPQSRALRKSASAGSGAGQSSTWPSLPVAETVMTTVALPTPTISVAVATNTNVGLSPPATAGLVPDIAERDP